MLFQRCRREIKLGLNSSSHACEKICYKPNLGGIFNIFLMVDIVAKIVLSKERLQWLASVHLPITHSQTCTLSLLT